MQTAGVAHTRVAIGLYGSPSPEKYKMGRFASTMKTRGGKDV